MAIASIKLGVDDICSLDEIYLAFEEVYLLYILWEIYRVGDDG